MPDLTVFADVPVDMDDAHPALKLGFDRPISRRTDHRRDPLVRSESAEVLWLETALLIHRGANVRAVACNPDVRIAVVG